MNFELFQSQNMRFFTHYTVLFRLFPYKWEKRKATLILESVTFVSFRQECYKYTSSDFPIFAIEFSSHPLLLFLQLRYLDVVSEFKRVTVHLLKCMVALFPTLFFARDPPRLFPGFYFFADRETDRHHFFALSLPRRQRVSDDIIKRVADVHMSPWSKGSELDEANSASARARTRIAELERELEEITKKAMLTSTHARQTAKQMAQQASMEDASAMSNSYRKSRKVMVESAQRVR